MKIRLKILNKREGYYVGYFHGIECRVMFLTEPPESIIGKIIEMSSECAVGAPVFYPGPFTIVEENEL